MGVAELGGVLAGRYRLRAVLRRGGTGTVWLASDGLLHRDVAVAEIPWVPRPDGNGQESRHERTIREARALARLGHPGIVGVLDVVEDGSRPWLVLAAAPYRFPCRPLTDVVRDDGPLRPAWAARAGLQILDALRAAHAAGVLHRDLKPANVMLGAEGRVVLGGFGMVIGDGSPALTTPESLTGSPGYLAPERARGDPATPAADLWSLGATLYAAVEGRPPFDRDGAVAVLTAVMGGVPDPPGRAGPLWPVISGLLRKDPAARPDTAGLAWLLSRVAAGHRAGAPAPPVVVPAQRSAPAEAGHAGADVPPQGAPAAVAAGTSGGTAPEGSPVAGGGDAVGDVPPQGAPVAAASDADADVPPEGGPPGVPTGDEGAPPQVPPQRSWPKTRQVPVSRQP